MISLKMMDSVKKYSLSNGLTVLLEKNPEAPVISLNIGVKVGSVWENNEEAGISHLLEHMVFKGTTHYKPGEIATLVEGSGGELNAYTAFDQTVYFINLSSKYQELGLKLLSEMVFEASIDPVELEREKEVVLEEIRRGKDNPNHILGEMLFDLAFQKHPYGRPIIGYDPIVKNTSRDTILNFYHRWYVPNNMVLCICGDFEEAGMISLIESIFGSYASIPIDRPELPEEPLPTSTRKKYLGKAIQGNYLTFGFPVPAFIHKDIPALDLLAHLLGAGETSRLDQNVKEKKGLVNSIQAYAYTPRFAGLFIVDAQVPDKTLHEVVPAIWEEIDYAKKHLFPQENIERARQTMLSGIYYEKETCEGMARKLISFETTADDYRYEKEYLEALKMVTPQDIRAMAQKYLKNEFLSLALLHPESNKVKHVDTSKILRASKPKRDKAYQLVEECSSIKKYEFKNGLRVVLKENHRLPLVAVRAGILGGLRYENAGNNGIGHMLCDLLTKGTKTKSALKIAEINEQISGPISGSIGKNSWGVAGSFLSDKIDLGLELFGDLLLNPVFDEKELKKEKRLTLEAIKNQEDSLSYVAFQKFASMLYQKHPYGMPLMGTKLTVPKLSREAIRRYHQRLLQPSKMVVTAAGDFDCTDLLEYFSTNLGQLKNNRQSSFKIKAEKEHQGLEKTEIRKKDKMQAHIVLGFYGTTLTDPDRYVFEVLNNILCGQGGRLFLELRDKQSLAYTVTAVLQEGLEPGYFATYIGTEPQKIEKAIDGMLLQLKQIREDNVPDQELERAKNYIVGNYQMDLQKNSTYASALTFNELYGHELSEIDTYPEKIMSVTSEEVLSIAQKYLDLDAYKLVIVRP